LPSSGTSQGHAIPFVAAWEAHQRAVYRACLVLLGGRREDAEEVFSRVAMRAFEKWPSQLNDTAHAKAWLLAITRNACVDLHRERVRSREVSLETVPDFVAHADPEHVLLKEEDRRRLRSSLSRLPLRLRVVAEMHFVTEMSYRDIARELGISELNVRKRMQQARASIRGGNDKPARARADSTSREAPLVRLPVRVTTDDGVERAVVLQLPPNARPLPQRREALQRYIQRHPRGWRKRLELARTLAAMGELREAVGHYRFVVARQPFPLRPWVELGTILEAIGRVAEAAAVYAEGVRQVGRESDREELLRLAAEARRQE
jgi:RNA polymerase sigma factor (sigma-70 family)